MQMLTSPIQESMTREKYYNLIKVKIFINWSVINLANSSTRKYVITDFQFVPFKPFSNFSHSDVFFSIL